MDANTKNELLTLAKFWRDKAAHIENKFSGAPPDRIAEITAAFETCATELEALAGGETSKNPPSPCFGATSQNEGSGSRRGAEGAEAEKKNL